MNIVWGNLRIYQRIFLWSVWLNVYTLLHTHKYNITSLPHDCIGKILRPPPSAPTKEVFPRVPWARYDQTSKTSNTTSTSIKFKLLCTCLSLYLPPYLLTWLLTYLPSSLHRTYIPTTSNTSKHRSKPVYIRSIHDAHDAWCMKSGMSAALGWRWVAVRLGIWDGGCKLKVKSCKLLKTRK